MNELSRGLHWKSALSAIALTVGAFGIGSSAEAFPTARNSFKLAQVGVRSRINPPTPLNLRPQTHIPLPTNSRSSDRHYNSGYGGYHGGYPRHDEYGHGHHHHRDRHRGKRRNRGPVIIINPANSSYSNYSNKGSYIRINRN